MLSLFHNNGSIFDVNGNIVIQGYIKITFDGGVYIGWFDGSFTVTETAEKPYLFELSSTFQIDREELVMRTEILDNQTELYAPGIPQSDDPQFDPATATVPGTALDGFLNRFEEEQTGPVFRGVTS